MVSVTLSAVVGNFAVCWLLRFCVRTGPYTACVLSLAAADVGLICIAGILLEDILRGHEEMTSPIAKVREPVSAFSDTVGLCVLVAMSVESTLGILFLTWYCHHGPNHTSVVVSAPSWALAFSLQVGTEACDYWEQGPACRLFHTGFTVFRLFICSVVCVSSLTLAVCGLCHPQQCSLTRTYRDAYIVAVTFLLWGLPLAIVLPARRGTSKPDP
jgi:hypothetical protein